MSNKGPVCLYWFRKALRLHDNPALVKAQQIASNSSDGKLLMVFVLDPVFLNPTQPDTRAGTGIGRCSTVPLRFLCESLDDLDDSIQTLNINQRLVLLEGNPLDELPKLWKENSVTHVLFEAEQVEPYGKRRDLQVMSEARRFGITVVTFNSHTLFPMDKYPTRRPSSYSSFLGEFYKLGTVPLPEPTLSALADSPSQFSNARTSFDIVSVPKKAPGAESPFPGGEKEGLARLKRRVIDNPKWVKKFSKPDSSPCQFEPVPSTTALSAYLTFGCLSVRQFWKALGDAESNPGPNTRPPESLKGQLLWREHFYLQAYHVGEPFDRMEGNPICRQIPWKTWEKGKASESEHFERFLAWKEGRTGHPFIDACMRQLVTTGWMHHLARHAVACFVTRGDLFIHWEHARDVFSEYLVDGDWSLNNANWMWLSCSSFFYQYFRVYGPESFPKKYDPNGNFVRRFVPEIAKFPKEFIYAPWKAPLAIQQRCGCIIGTDYPMPLVPDHAETSKQNIEIIRAAYEASAAHVEARIDTKHKKARVT